MRYDKPTRTAKRFCLQCNTDQKMKIVAHKTYDMYHCSVCGDEAMRVGDGYVAPVTPRVSGGVDTHGLLEDGHTKPSTILARERTDVMSDEHSMWPARDNEDREDLLRTFKAALSGLTARQKQVLEAVERSGSVSRAAVVLGISQPAVTMTLQKIAKKLRKKVMI